MSRQSKNTFRFNNSVFMYMEELGARVVAQSGVPSDRYHLGKIILQGLRDDPSHILQVDGGLDVSETNSSVLERSIRCAIALRSLGLQRGDVIVLMAPNHVDLCIPFYANFYIGTAVAAVDRFLGVHELKDSFNVNKPKMVFCQSDKASDVEAALKLATVNARVVTFDKGTQNMCLEDLLNNVNETDVRNFRATDFDAEETLAMLITTSGSTGLPKSAAVVHKSMTIGITGVFARFYEFPKPTRMFLFPSPLQWLSAVVAIIMSPILRYTRLQTSLETTREHTYHLINTYKPTMFLTSPNFMSTIIAKPYCKSCDFSCLENIMLGGSFVSQKILEATRALAPEADVNVAYGMSETTGLIFSWDQDHPTGSVGRPIGFLQHRLIDIATLKDIDEPNVVGELWIKGSLIFKGYYNNPKATKETFSEDGWFKTGDLMYRDQYHHYMFVDRLKMLLKFKNHQISPVEIEDVILSHPGVLEVAVTGVQHSELGDLPAAAVERRHGSSVTAQEIKDCVKDRLTDTKHLRGGVVFLNELPTTASTKIDRMKLKKMVAEMERE